MTSRRSAPAPTKGRQTEGEAGRILAGARQARIAEIVERIGFVSVAEVAATLGVSGMTIRRDLERLEVRGLLTRTHGGAMAMAVERSDTAGRSDSAARGETYDAEEPAFERRRRRNATAKARIARAAAGLVGAGETVALDVGTSTLALAEELVARDDLRVFTNNLRAAIALTRSRSPVYLLGGQLRGAELAVVGPAATAQVNDYYFDRVFLGVSGVTEAGYFDYALEDSEMKRAFIARARQVIVLCDGSKFDHRALARICALGDAGMIVTDRAPPAHLRRAFDQARVELLVAAP
jgi:DeoR family glycerol-3-phosphate regulon repressor